MASPLGHSAAGLCLYYVFRYSTKECPASDWRTQLAVPAVLLAANLPDLDLLFSWLLSGNPARYHQLYSHNFVVLAAAAGILSYLLPLHRKLRISLLVYASILGLHLLLDAAVGPQLFQSGTLGIPLLWPFSSASMGTPLALIPMLHYGRPELILTWANGLTLLFEAALAASLFLFIRWYRTKN